MSYPDFVWFLLSEEDKKHPRRCDLLKELYFTMTFALIYKNLFILNLIIFYFFPLSIEYWFRCMDVDGDGVLSMYELEYFYTEQVSKMDALGIETMVFQDCLCQVWVLIVWAIQF